MSEFFFEYGLFAAKFLTVFIILMLFLIVFLLILANKNKEREFIEIEKVNDKYDSMRDALEAEILSKAELKELRKQRKKEEKEQEKIQKRKSKDETNEDQDKRQRLFVLRFNGDMQASEVENLREAITALLTIAKPEDEVLLTLDSAGGLVHDYGLAASQLQRIRSRQIPLTIAVDLIAASGGYMMAVVGNKILAAPFAIIGSIGVLAQIPNVNRLLEKHDIDIEQHTAGEYKTTLTILGKNTDKARKKFREELEDTHVLFKKFVHEHRPQLNIDQLATGEHWYGSDALNLKLIDEIITSDDYLLEKVKTTDIYEINYVITETFSDKISSLLQNTSLKLMKNAWSFFKRPIL